MKIGDKVRFISDVGGGTIAGFQGKNIVLVEDEDGFQMPTAINDVVVIEEENYDTGNMLAKRNAQESPGKKKIVVDDNEDYDPSDRPVTFKSPTQERKGGDELSAYLAFVPMDVKALTHTRFEAYFVNDSNYYMRYILLSAEGTAWKLRATAEVEPNTKEFIEEFGRENLDEMEHLAVQIVAFKRNRTFMIKPAIDVQIRVDGVKFYKLHTFSENDFFEEPALIYTIVENDKPARPLVIDAKQLKQEMNRKIADDQKPKPQPARKEKKGDDIVVVDLHANELLDSTSGMSASDILNYQLEKFRSTLKEYEKKKGQRIVFIHGKGEGVLRRAIVNELKYKYKQYTYQDASFQEYGYGATQVKIN